MLLLEIQTSVLAMELIEEDEDVLQAAAQTVNRPSSYHVTLLSLHGMAQAVKAGAKFIRASDLKIHELSDNLPSFYGCHTFQFTKLMLDGRPIPTDIGVEGNPLLFIHRKILKPNKPLNRQVNGDRSGCLVIVLALS